MQYTLDDIEGRYLFVPPEEGVSLADLGAASPTYSTLEDGRVIPRITVRPQWVPDESISDLVWSNGGEPAEDLPRAQFAELVRGVGSAPVPATLDDSMPLYVEPDAVPRGDVLPNVRTGHDEEAPAEMIYRGAVLPFSKDARGRFYLDWDAGIPGAIKRGLTLAGDVASGRISMQTEDGRHNPEIIERALDMTSLGGVGALRTATLRGNPPKFPVGSEVLAAKIPPAESSVSKARAGESRTWIFDFPNKPEISLQDYYGLSPINANKAGRLLQTPEGYRLKPNVPTVGYTSLTGKQEALSPGQIERLARQITKNRLVPLSTKDAKEMGALGAFTPFFEAIFYRDSLDAATKNRVIAHELGHAFHHFTPKMIDELWKNRNFSEYRKVYSRGRSGRDSGPPLSPFDFKYPYTEFPAEWIAELTRAYLTNPNYAKVEAPHAAAFIRRMVNSNPKLSKYIQLNSTPGLPMLPTLGVWPQDTSDKNTDR